MSKKVWVSEACEAGEDRVNSRGGDGRVQKSHLLVPTRGSAVSPLGCHYYMEPYLEKLADSVIVAVFTGEEMG